MEPLPITASTSDIVPGLFAAFDERPRMFDSLLPDIISAIIERMMPHKKIFRYYFM